MNAHLSDLLSDLCGTKVVFLVMYVCMRKVIRVIQMLLIMSVIYVRVRQPPDACIAIAQF